MLIAIQIAPHLQIYGHFIGQPEGIGHSFKLHLPIMDIRRLVLHRSRGIDRACLHTHDLIVVRLQPDESLNEKTDLSTGQGIDIAGSVIGRLGLLSEC